MGGGEVRIYDSYFINNTASYVGGAIHEDGFTIVLERSSFFGNRAEVSSAVFATPSPSDAGSSITNCTFALNTSTGGDGTTITVDYHNDRTRMHITNNTIVYNSNPNTTRAALYLYGPVNTFFGFEL